MSSPRSSTMEDGDAVMHDAEEQKEMKVDDDEEEEEKESATAAPHTRRTLSTGSATLHVTSTDATAKARAFFIKQFEAADYDLAQAMEEAQQQDRPIRIGGPAFLKNRLERVLAALTETDIKLFIEGFKSFISIPSTFVQLLTPTRPLETRPSSHLALTQRTADLERKNAVYTLQDPIIRILLLIEPLQLRIVEQLMNKLMEIRQQFMPSRTSELPSLILSTLRWLDQVYDPARIYNQFLQTMNRLSDDQVLSAVIQALPEVIAQPQHKNMVDALMKLMHQQDNITAAVLDTLLHLQMDVDTTNSVIDKLIDTLPSKPISDLPGIVRFIVQASGNVAELQQSSRSKANLKANDAHLSDILKRLRHALNLSPLVSASQDESGRRKHQQQEAYVSGSGSSSSRSTSSAPLLTIEALQQSIRFHSKVGLVWLKELDVELDYKPCDIWMMFILFSFPNQEDKVVKLMRTKLTTPGSTLTIEALETAIEYHADVVQSLFPLILRLCNALLQQPDPTCHQAAMKLQTACFNTFENESDRRQVIDAFVKQIGKTIEKNISNAALSSLWQLITRVEETTQFQPYREPIFNLINYLHTFGKRQQLIIADIIAAINLEKSSKNELKVNDKFRIIYIKHLQSTVVAHQILGVCFVVALLKRVGGVVQRSADEVVPRGSNSLDLFNEIWQECMGSLEQLSPIQKSSHRTQILDELALAVESGSMHSDVYPTLLSQTKPIWSSYEVKCQLPLDLSPEALREAQDCTLIVMLNLQSGPSHMISILPKLADPTTRPFQHQLAAALRLYGACTKRMGEAYIRELGNDLLSLGVAGFQMPSSAQLEEDVSKDVGYLMISTVLHTINYFRTLISVLASLADETLDPIIFTRLRHMHRLEEKLETLVGAMTDAHTLPYGLTLDEEEFVTRQFDEHIRHQTEKREKENESNKKAKTKIDFWPIVRELIRPYQFDVFSLLSRSSLDFHRDDIWHDACKHKKKVTANLLSQVASHEKIPVSEVLTKPELSVYTFRYLFHQLVTQLQVARDVTLHDPLAQCKFRPIHLADDLSEFPPLNTADPMDPYEFAEALREVWPKVGEVREEHCLLVVHHLIAHGADDEEVESEENFESVTELEAFYHEIPTLCKFLLEQLSAPAGQSEEQKEKFIEALAKFVSCITAEAESDEEYRKYLSRSTPGSELHSCQILLYLLRSLGQSLTGDFNVAVHILSVMATLLKCIKNKTHLYPIVYEFCDQLLKYEWSSSTKMTKQTLSFVVKEQIQHFSNGPIDGCQEMLELMGTILHHELKPTDAASNELSEEQKQYAHSMDIKNAHLYFQPVLDVLTDRWKSCVKCPSGKDALRDYFINLGHLAQHFRSVASLFEDIYINPENKCPPPLSLAILRQGRIVLDAITKQKDGFRSHHRQHKKEIINMLTNLQRFTRRMNVICIHGKRHNVSGLLSIIPGAKVALVSFTQFVQMMSKEMNEPLILEQKSEKSMATPAVKASKKRKSREEDEEEEADEQESKSVEDEDEDESMNEQPIAEDEEDEAEPGGGGEDEDEEDAREDDQEEANDENEDTESEADSQMSKRRRPNTHI